MVEKYVCHIIFVGYELRVKTICDIPSRFPIFLNNQIIIIPLIKKNEWKAEEEEEEANANKSKYTKTNTKISNPNPNSSFIHIHTAHCHCQNINAIVLSELGNASGIDASSNDSNKQSHENQFNRSA